MFNTFVTAFKIVVGLMGVLTLSGATTTFEKPFWISVVIVGILHGIGVIECDDIPDYDRQTGDDYNTGCSIRESMDIQHKQEQEERERQEYINNNMPTR